MPKTTVQLHFDPEQDAWLRRRAADGGVSLSSVVRGLVRDAMRSTSGHAPVLEIPAVILADPELTEVWDATTDAGRTMLVRACRQLGDDAKVEILKHRARLPVA